MSREAKKQSTPQKQQVNRSQFHSVLYIKCDAIFKLLSLTNIILYHDIMIYLDH